MKFQNLMVRSAEQVANFEIELSSSSDRVSILGVSPSFPPSRVLVWKPMGREFGIN